MSLEITTLTPEHRIAQREKQIKMGKITSEYKNYVREVSRDKRIKGLMEMCLNQNTMIFEELPKHPETPRADDLAITKRTFDKQLAQWRRALHRWDQPESSPKEFTLNFYPFVGIGAAEIRKQVDKFGDHQ